MTLDEAAKQIAGPLTITDAATGVSSTFKDLAAAKAAEPNGATYEVKRGGLFRSPPVPEGRRARRAKARAEARGEG